MTYSKLVAISGMSGLFELVSSRADGGVVKSLEDKTTKFVSNRQHNFSHLESIEIYTTGENINLADVFKTMKESSEKLPDGSADPKTIKAYFEKIIPAMDFDKVYASDMKKMIKWLDIITRNGIEIELSGTSGEEESQNDNSSKKASSAASSKAPVVKGGPAKKINTPRKMA